VGKLYEGGVTQAIAENTACLFAFDFSFPFPSFSFTFPSFDFVLLLPSLPIYCPLD